MKTQKPEPEYQLVLEYLDSDPEAYDRVIAIQLRLTDSLALGHVDGNDAGQGIVNLFVDTDDPSGCFGEIMTRTKDFEDQPQAAGYRRIDEDDFVRLWPKGDATPFIPK